MIRVVTSLALLGAAVAYDGVNMNDDILDLIGPATPPAPGDDYTLIDGKRCNSDRELTASRAAFTKYAGGKTTNSTPGIADCIARCESFTGCEGLVFSYGLEKIWPCTKDDCATPVRFSCIPYKGSLQADKCSGHKDDENAAIYMRKAGAVAPGEEAARQGWVGDAPAAVEGYIVYAGFDAGGGDCGELLKAGSGKTVADCAAECAKKDGCFAFNYNFKKGSSTVNRCVCKKSPDPDVNFVAREGMAVYVGPVGGISTPAPTSDSPATTQTATGGEFSAATEATAASALLAVVAVAAIKLWQ